jgi:hypothetical protein
MPQLCSLLNRPATPATSFLQRVRIASAFGPLLLLFVPCGQAWRYLTSRIMYVSMLLVIGLNKLAVLLERG